MKPIILGLALLTFLIAGGCARREVVSASEFHQLAPGMTYDEVSKIIGQSGHLRGDGEQIDWALAPRPGQQVYVWTNADGSLASAAFANGHLVATSNSNL